MQDTYYAVAIGADYRENKYTAYLQFMDFSQVAKTEQGKASEKIPIWIATGTGPTMVDALRDILTISPQPYVLSHVSSVILTDRAIEHGLNGILDYLGRYPDFRTTASMFGTKDDLTAILSATPLFNLAPLTMIEHSPESIAKQHTYIPPLEVRDFNMQYRDTANTVILPCLSLTNDWMEGEKPHPQPYINGAFLFQHRQYRNWLSARDLSGYRWVTPNTKRSILLVRTNQRKPAMEVAVWYVKPTIEAHMQNGNPVFNVRVRGKATILADYGADYKADQMIKKEITEEIRSTFLSGVNNGADVLHLENALYRKHNQMWKETFQKNHLSSVDKGMLGDVKVDIKISHAGRLRIDS